MHIWMLKAGEPWPLDQNNRLGRTGQLVRALVERGHRVTWWLGSIEHKTKQFRGVGEWQLENRCDVIALNGMAYKKNVSISRYIYNRQIATQFARAAKGKDRPDLVLSSLPCHHFAWAGVRYARENGCTSLVDYRDLWPDAFENFMPWWLARIALLHDYHVQKRAFASADAVVGISPGYVKQALAKVGRKATNFDRHFYLGAFPLKASGSNGQVPEKLKAFAGRKIIAYVGTFGRSYELAELLYAARELASERSDFVVVLCGAGEKDLSVALKGHPAAVALGWMDADSLGRFLPLCYAGMMPFQRGAPQSVPNKAFDYFSASVPVVSSLEGEMQELIDRKSLGVHYRPGDPKTLRAAMRRVLDAPDERDVWAQNAKRFFEEEGNSESIYPDYCDYLEDLVAVTQNTK